MVEAKELVRMPMSVSLRKERVSWLGKKVESRVYANRSHELEVLILEAVKNEKKE